MALWLLPLIGGVAGAAKGLLKGENRKDWMRDMKDGALFGAGAMGLGAGAGAFGLGAGAVAPASVPAIGSTAELAGTAASEAAAVPSTLAGGLGASPELLASAGGAGTGGALDIAATGSAAGEGGWGGFAASHPFLAKTGEGAAVSGVLGGAKMAVTPTTTTTAPSGEVLAPQKLMTIEEMRQQMMQNQPKQPQMFSNLIA